MAVISTPLSYGEGFELNRFSWQANRLVGWWPLGAYPHVTDKSLYRNDGASEVGCGGGGLCDSSTPRATSPVSHGQRRALLFDASSKDIVQVPTNILNCGGVHPEVQAASRTVSCWVLCNSKATNSMGFVSTSTSGTGGQPGWMLGRNGSQDYFQYWSNGSTGGGIVSGSTSFSTGVWYYVVGTHDGTTVNLYVNGILEGTASHSSWTGSTQPLTFGKWYPNYDCCYFDGLLDDIRLYRRALGANEVAAIYNQTKDGGYGELAAQPTKRLFHFSGTVNLAPTAVALTNKVDSLSEDADTTSATKIADIVVTDDDGEGTNTLSVSGTDAASFEVVGTELRLKAGVTLDYEIKNSYAVTVEVDDTEVGSTPDLTVSHVLGILLVPENKQVDLVEGPSSSFDVVTEIRDERRGATGRGVSWQPGPAQVVTYGTRSDPSTQAVLDRLDNRFVTTAARRIG